MKKLKFLIISIFALMLGFAPILAGVTENVNKNAYATNEAEIEIVYSKEEFAGEADDILNKFKSFKDRVPGSSGEKDAAQFIIDYLSAVTGLSAKQTAHIDGGVQKFTFESVFTGKYENSQNIIFNYIGDSKSDKKIVIGTHYDAVAYKENSSELIGSESIAGSAGSVAFVLALANAAPRMNWNFNIEFVLFGAGESNNAGSNFYTKGIGSEEKDNTLLMINFDNVLIGRNVYFYTDEVADDFSNSMVSLSDKLNLDVERVNTVHLHKVVLAQPNELGLDYIHVAMTSDNFNFMKRGIKTINFFAGDYSSGIVIGKSEYFGYDIVSYTENDNLEYITEKYGQNYITNMMNVFEILNAKFSEPTFMIDLANGAGQNSWFYKIFANRQLVVFMTVVALVLFIIISMLIHYKLTVKAYYANVEMEFLNSVVKICENVGDGEIFNEEMPAKVSKKIAEDIKQDKAIRVSRKNKDDKDKDK